MKTLSLRIVRHTETLQGLQIEIDGLYEAVETKTGEAREKLLIYRMLKERAEKALDDVAAGYDQAQSLFGQADALFEKLRDIRDDHNRLSEIAVQREDAESVRKLQQAREQLKQVYGKIRRLKAESLTAELAEKPCIDGVVEKMLLTAHSTRNEKPFIDGVV
jgi:FtsZ-binding cell division protein ZapB